MRDFKKRIIRNSLLLILIITAGVNVYAVGPKKKNDKSGNNTPTPTAGCAAATEKAVLELNNVRARIDGTGGSMWYDRANGNAAYEIPKQINEGDPRFTSIYAGALWMGGLDVNGNIKLAAVTFRLSGNDFWPGPLNVATADVDAETCNEYDRFFGVSRAMVDQFVGWYQAGIDDALTGGTSQQDDYPGYSIPKAILEWPAHGDISKGQDWHLAPFFDRDGDDFYDPNAGDYPKYDLDGSVDCRTTRDIRLFGDTTLWFVFNDKGNTHSESQGPSIGMEIRGQAFSFSTNDDVNNMTFYNYEMINRSTFTLTETYFGQWVDSDLGNASDDFVGCDASRGLGYSYNGDNDDEDTGIPGYGSTPPAVGVDFFEGPFADNDGIDNPLTQNIPDAIDSNGIPYKGLGIGYGDGIIDNERYGMKKFVYYNQTTSVTGDPTTALDHYNYMRGKWRDGSDMVWGGDGHFNTGGSVSADLLFPGSSDPLFWSTKGNSAVIPANWTELSAGNIPADRRFLESAGPFTLKPGAVNDLTVGVLWARASSGNQFESVKKLLVADDKAQSLFDNCFKVSEGPDAPDLTIQELENELVIYLSNRKISNNYKEEYNQLDPFIAIPDTIDGVWQGLDADKDTLRFYEFQGYQIFQVKSSSVSVSELYDVAVSRLAIQVDIKDGITQLVNFEFDDNLNANIPQEMVNGKDEGIQHSFRITTDLFATGDVTSLINHKTYYYIAIAYGYNEYKNYDQSDPNKLDGQKKPYIASRKMAGGAGIASVSAIPHNPSPEAGGTTINAGYGDQPQITRVEGQGNGGNLLELTSTSEDRILANNSDDFPVYQQGKGPITVKVVDPLNVRGGKYRLQFKDTITPGVLDDAFWVLHLPDGKVVSSDQTIELENEQLFLDYGISISVTQHANPGVDIVGGNGMLTSSIQYDDPSKEWLGGFSDLDGQTDGNWIRSGTANFNEGTVKSAFNDNWEGPGYIDPNQTFESLINGTWSPYGLVSNVSFSVVAEPKMLDAVGFSSDVLTAATLATLNSVDIVFTADRSKWSRCMVIEARNDIALAVNNAPHLSLRRSPSVDKDGNDDGSGTTGLGWFPGYAINLETGQRLNIAFAEDSWLVAENGRDMIWNPTSTAYAGVNGELRMGGKHYVYVFRETFGSGILFPIYDGCTKLHEQMSLAEVNQKNAMKSCIWAGVPMLEAGHSLLETTVKVKLRVEKEYAKFNTSSGVNGGLPMYEFDMSGLATEFNSNVALDAALQIINVVPNPYYAYSEYETGKLDNRVKITNLPEECTVSIYNVNGTLMRRFNKADSKTSLDWDLKNHVDIPVASGVYLIHVKIPNVGERTLKWFGVIKPTDLNGF